MCAKKMQSENPRLVELARKINEGYGKLVGAMRTSLEQAKEIGLALLEAKMDVQLKGDLQFHKWIEENCKVSVPQAQRYMRVAKMWKDLKEQMTEKELEDLTLVGALKLLSHKGKGETAPVTKTVPAKLTISTKDLNEHLAYADDIEFKEKSSASKLVEKQAAQIAQQILRLVSDEEGLKDRDGNPLDKIAVALAVLGQIKFSLDADLLFNVVDEVETAEVVVSDTTESNTSQASQPDVEAHRRNGKGELAFA